MVLKSASLLKYYRCTKSYLHYGAGKEIKVRVPWGVIAGKWYGPMETRPILALHGWMDNYDTLERLIRGINKQDVSFLAIDLPGHGMSSKFPPDMTYDHRNYVLMVHYLVQHFQWSKLSIMGHCMGSKIAYSYGTTFPNVPDFMICLDSDDISLQDSFYNANHTYPEFKTFLTTRGVKSYLAHYILDRNIIRTKRSSDQFRMLTDPRFQREFNEHNNSPRSEIKFPMLFVGGGTESASVNNSEKCELHRVAGDKYNIINNPDVYALLIKKFLDKNNAGERLTGVSDTIILCSEQDKTTQVNKVL